jgi:hypothetical protein
MLLRDYFEILFIAAIYLGVAWMLAQQGLNDALEHWLTGGVLVGAIATLINRFGQSRYRGNGASEIETETETRMHRITKTDTRPAVIEIKTDPKDTQNG